MKYVLAAFAAGAVPLVPDGCGCGTATCALIKGCFCQCLDPIFPSWLTESNSKHGCGQQSRGRSASLGGTRAAGAGFGKTVPHTSLQIKRNICFADELSNSH